jgi:hypothetical protein
MKLGAVLLPMAKRLRAGLPTAIRDATGLAGMGLVAYGAHEIFHPLGWIILGVECVAGAGLVAIADARSRSPAVAEKTD